MDILDNSDIEDPRWDSTASNSMEVLSMRCEPKPGEDPEPELVRPCVDCGLITGRFCDGLDRICRAAMRIPSEKWCPNQMTPFCGFCEAKYPACRFCRRIPSCTPFATNVYKGNDGLHKEAKREPPFPEPEFLYSHEWRTAVNGMRMIYVRDRRCTRRPTDSDSD